MTRLYLLLLLIVVGGALLGVAIVQHPGYVLVAYQDWRFESSLWAFLALLAALLLIYWLVRLVVRAAGASGQIVNPWSGYNRHRRLQRAGRRGLLQLAEGHWRHAQSLLEKAGKDEQLGVLPWLGAAQAAHAQGLFSDEDELLAQARNRFPKETLAIALTEIPGLLERSELERAAERLETVRTEHPRHPPLLKLRAALHERRQEWAQVCELVPELKRHKVFGEAELVALEQRAWLNNLQQTAVQARNLQPISAQPLKQCWRDMPSTLQDDSRLLAEYALQLETLEAFDEAERVLRQALKKRYDAKLVLVYANLRGSDPVQRLAEVERLLPGHADDAFLLSALGHLSRQSKLWGKAREYFEASLRLAPNARTCAELAALLAQLGETQRSQQLFQDGLRLLDQSHPSLT